MAKEKLESDKPAVNVMAIGETDHGKTTLAAALTRVCSDMYGSTRVAFDAIDAASAEAVGGLGVRAARVQYDSHVRRYDHTDAPVAAIARNLIVGAPADCAVLVVSATGSSSTTREHVMLARQAGVPRLVVFLNKAEKADEEELLEFVKADIRELLGTCDYSGDDTPIIVGSALMALNGEDGKKLGTTAVKKLVETLDSYVPEPVPTADLPFALPVEDVRSADGGAVVTGQVERGTIAAHHLVEVIGLDGAPTATCTEVERADVKTSLRLKGVKAENIARGQLLAKPGSVREHVRFTARVYMLTKDEGGSAAPVMWSSAHTYVLRTAEITGNGTLSAGAAIVTPGEHLHMQVTLSVPVALEEGQRFQIRDKDKTVGIGVVVKIIM